MMTNISNFFWGITPDHVLELFVRNAEVGEESMGSSWQGTQDGRSDNSHAPWGEYRKYFEGVRIKKGITDIGGFYGLSNLKWAELDDGIKTIGYRAFSDCKVLEKRKITC